jgi:ATP diphosphatase
VLFVMANIGRVLKVDPELALRTANRKFERRFKAIEETLASQNRKPQDASLQELTDLWNKVRKSA